jgi:hypothetical protein
MPIASHHKQTVEMSQEFIRGPASFDQAGLLRPLNPALDRILIEPSKELVDLRAQIDYVQKVSRRRLKSHPGTRPAEIFTGGTNLKVLAMLEIEGSLRAAN